PCRAWRRAGGPTLRWPSPPFQGGRCERSAALRPSPPRSYENMEISTKWFAGSSRPARRPETFVQRKSFFQHLPFGVCSGVRFLRLFSFIINEKNRNSCKIGLGSYNRSRRINERIAATRVEEIVTCVFPRSRV